MDNISDLKKKVGEIRTDIINMISKAGSGHPGGSLSSAELLSALYFSKMKHNPEKVDWPDRDRFILSKGHACPLLYAILAKSGYFASSNLDTLRQTDSILQGHPDRIKTPGVDMSSGSLGQGLSVGVGLALAAKLDRKDWRTYVLMGDGELQSGAIWEAAMSASHYKLDNLCGIVDCNRFQIDGAVEDIMNIGPVVDKWKAFGWNSIEIDGHNLQEILKAYDDAAAAKDKPTVIVANTVKGKGVSFMENVCDWHGKAPDGEQCSQAVREIEKLHE
ncbi:MAG: transketolase [bacterium]